MQDVSLTCRDCGAPFLFTIGEQEFFAQKGYSNRPTRCPDCRQRMARPMPAVRPPAPPGQRPARERFEVVCAACNKATTVPFKPTQGRPVYCTACFNTPR